MAETKVTSELAAKVWQIAVSPGAKVAEGDTLVVLESMKMEIPVTAPAAGIVARVLVAKDDAVKEGQVLVVLTS